MNKKIILLFQLTFFCGILLAQNTSYKERVINKEIPQERVEELESAFNYVVEIQNAEKTIISNDKSIQNLKEKNNSTTNKKEIKIIHKKIKTLEQESNEKLAEIANLYYLNYKTIYSVYRDRLVTYQTSDRYRRIKVNRLLEEAKQNKAQMRLLLENISEIQTYSELKNEVEGLNLLRVEGIDKLQEGFCTYIDCYKVKENNIVLTINNNQQINKANKNKYKVEFKIQILAVSKKQNLNYLKNKFPKINDIEESYCNELKLFKYTTGLFTDYYEAKDFSENIEIRDVFIVGYINGKRCNIEEAIKKSKSSY